MKFKMSKLVATALTIAAMVFSSCENDSYDGSDNGNLKISKISLKDPLIQKNTKLIQEAKKIKLKQQAQSSGKIVYDSINDFYFDDENGILVEDENGHKSYTFKIYRNKPTEKLENIVFNLKEDSSYEALLTTYDLNEIEKEKLFNDETFTPVDTPYITIVGKATDPKCDTVIDHCTAVYMDGVVYYVVTYANPCPQGSGGSGSPNGSSGTGSTGGSTGASTGGSTGYTPLPTLPTGTTQGSSSSGSGTVLTTPVVGGGSSIVGMPLTDKQSNFLRDLGFLREEFSQLNVNVVMPVLNYINTCNATQYMSALNYFRSLNYMWLAEQSEYNQISIFNFLIQNNFSLQSKDFINTFITQSISTPELQLDFNMSLKSPSFIDMSSVMGNSPEELKFREVYNLVCTSPNFKNLFISLFGSSPLFNVKFQVANLPQNQSQITSGRCKMFNSILNSNPFNLIQIDREFLLTRSKFEVAQTIIHECIHAFLNIKLRNPSIGMTIETINNLDLQSCINTYYNGFSGNQTQHSFFVDHMIPILVEIFQDIKDLVITSEQANQLENPTNGAAIIYQPLNNPPILGGISSTQVSWNWDTFFTYFSYTGLQNCSAFPFSIPRSANHIFLNDNDYYFYYYISAFNAVINP
ncbi:hypothetical protein NAT51_02870 [Flavobacterium amniphilum]|uniref:hypothetical protein n=1 Tax=Flavobacterium amniphilum TaxID=1834035 RepID=UPI00202A79F6|nr:hypothetical protein [Flavobacterium amniphilum]MCL9804447.1 hypothetical protein [Flavobacterium amniphilum]